MNCEVEEGCEKKPKIMCSVHLKKFCGEHYGMHCLDCFNKAIRLEPSKKLWGSQIKSLNKTVAQIKIEIIGLANHLVLSIGKSLKNCLSCLDKQKTVMLDLMQIYKPESQINELLGVFSSKIPKFQNSFQDLVELEEMFSMKKFKAKVQDIENKFEAKNPPVNLVLKSLENFDLKGKIRWSREQHLVMLKDFDAYIGEIKITKNSTFVFICMD